MSQTTVAQYKEIYANKYGVQFPLSDADVVAAIAAAGTNPTVYPFDPEVVRQMKISAARRVGT